MKAHSHSLLNSLYYISRYFDWLCKYLSNSYSLHPNSNVISHQLYDILTGSRSSITLMYIPGESLQRLPIVKLHNSCRTLMFEIFPLFRQRGALNCDKLQGSKGFRHIFGQASILRTLIKDFFILRYIVIKYLTRLGRNLKIQ